MGSCLLMLKGWKQKIDFLNAFIILGVIRGPHPINKPNGGQLHFLECKGA